MPGVDGLRGGLVAPGQQDDLGVAVHRGVHDHLVLEVLVDGHHGLRLRLAVVRRPRVRGGGAEPATHWRKKRRLLHASSSASSSSPSSSASSPPPPPSSTVVCTVCKIYRRIFATVSVEKLNGQKRRNKISKKVNMVLNVHRNRKAY